MCKVNGVTLGCVHYNSIRYKDFQSSGKYCLLENSDSNAGKMQTLQLWQLQEYRGAGLERYPFGRGIENVDCDDIWQDT